MQVMNIISIKILNCLSTYFHEIAPTKRFPFQNLAYIHECTAVKSYLRVWFSTKYKLSKKVHLMIEYLFWELLKSVQVQSMFNFFDNIDTSHQPFCLKSIVCAMTSHNIARVMTSHNIARAMTSHNIARAMTSHNIARVMTSSVIVPC